MLRPDIRSLMNDPDIGGGQSFVIVRSYYQRSKGRLDTTPVVVRIDAVGSVQPAGVDALQQLPEADRSGKVIIIRSETKMQMGSTDANGDLQPDNIEYGGELYKVLQSKDWEKWGMSVAYATRIGVIE